MLGYTVSEVSDPARAADDGAPALQSREVDRLPVTTVWLRDLLPALTDGGRAPFRSVSGDSLGGHEISPQAHRTKDMPPSDLPLDYYSEDSYPSGRAV